MDKESLQKLIYGLSHDMGAPLRSVTQFSSLLAKRLEPKLDEKERYWLQLIQENGEKAQFMLQGLLTYSRLVTKQNPFAVFQLSEAIQSALLFHEKNILNKKASIKYTPTYQSLNGDQTQWELLFKELISNALLFQASNNIPEILIIENSSDENILLSIEDNGIGVREQDFSNICLPFKRLNGESEYTGLGMGLAFCEKVVTLHNGQISFEKSQLGGLKVTIKIAKNLDKEEGC
jgi:light-regulated signal transduction histidine kinase (bacteriophytochrome)